MISVVLALFGSHRVAELLCEEGQIEHQCRQMSCMNQSCFLHSLEMQSVMEYSCHKSAIRSVEGKSRSRLARITTKQQV